MSVLGTAGIGPRTSTVGVAEWRPNDWQPESGSSPTRRRLGRGSRWRRPDQLPLSGQQLRGHLVQRVRWLGPDLFGTDQGPAPPLHRAVSRCRGRAEGRRWRSTAASSIPGSPPSVTPLLGLAGITTTGTTARHDGRLEIRFANRGSSDRGLRGGHSVGDDGRRSGWLVPGEGRVSDLLEAEGGSATRADRRIALLVRAYIEYSATDRPDLFWSFDRLRDLIEHAPDDAYDVIRELVRLAPSPLCPWHRRCGGPRGGPAVRLGASG